MPSQYDTSATLQLAGTVPHVTLRPGHKVRATVGLPGTGLIFSEGGSVHRRHVLVPTAGITWRDWSLAAVVLALSVGMVMNNIK
jgi:hypothetical protein